MLNKTNTKKGESLMIKKLANKLAVKIINKRGSGDSCVYDDVDNYLCENPEHSKLIDNEIGYGGFTDLVRDKLDLLYKIEFNTLPEFKTKLNGRA